MSLLELSLAIDWPTVGWTMLAIVVTLALAIASYEIASEIRRRKRIARRKAAFSRHGKHTQSAKQLPDGSLYAGELRDGKPHGRGIVTFPNGTRYEGEFQDGERRGKGVVTLPDGTRM